MIKHLSLKNKELASLIKENNIRLGGNAKLKIYGTLHCKSGKRMKQENRVLFSSDQDAKNEKKWLDKLDKPKNGFTN